MVAIGKMLAAMSEWGYRGIELVGPLLKLATSGYSFDFVPPPRSKPSPLLPPSIDTSYMDSPLGVRVTTAEDASLVKAFEATGLMMSRRAVREAMRR
jgi:hypothetical protein